MKGGLAQIDVDRCDVHVMILLILTAEQNPTRCRTISLIAIALALVVSAIVVSPVITVAVGTAITDRPPHRSVRARLRIRLLQRMSGVEACIGIGVQNTRWRNPPVQDWGKTFPTHLCALTTADQNTLP